MGERLESFLRAVGSAAEIVILPHNDPDPDAIASAVALRHLLTQRLRVTVEVAYRGIVGRAENRALVRYLGHPLRPLRNVDLHRRPLVLVDTQPGAGNNPLLPGSTVLAVIDHHPGHESPFSARHVDVRPRLGATSTMVTGYLQESAIEPSSQLSTALFYGVKTDTMGLSRGASAEDVAAYFYLQSRIDVDGLVEIERAQVPVQYFRKLDETLHAARIHKGVLLSHIGETSRPDMPAEMADLLLRLQGIEWVVCTGAYKDRLVLSVRTRSRRGGAGRLVQQIVADRGTAGGHGTMAGGQVPLQGQSAEQVAAQLGELALQFLKAVSSPAGKPLL